MSTSTEGQVPKLALSIAGVADAIGVSKNCVHALIAAGALRARKIGRRSLVLRADLEGYLQALPVHGGELAHRDVRHRKHADQVAG